ncbi:hypothetical protein T07_13836 [Trichinella nelsoni]|uniref:Uncharacterized protein n=1 Tax=Trichinella nelsoni TaxID=6336 RepID=A0A0V0S958_9BILA|nr:hypothetical protein T07_13836 [Trichinella nelsoni]
MTQLHDHRSWYSFIQLLFHLLIVNTRSIIIFIIMIRENIFLSTIQHQDPLESNYANPLRLPKVCRAGCTLTTKKYELNKIKQVNNNDD